MLEHFLASSSSNCCDVTVGGMMCGDITWHRFFVGSKVVCGGESKRSIAEGGGVSIILSITIVISNSPNDTINICIYSQFNMY